MPSGLASITQKRPAKSPACSITAAWTQVGRHLFSSRILPYFNACTTLPTPNTSQVCPTHIVHNLLHWMQTVKQLVWSRPV